MSFTDDQREALRLLRGVWPNEPIVVIGAAALGWHVEMTWRRTNDLDLTVTVSPERIADDLSRHGAFRRGRAEHVWFTTAGQRLDVLPAGPEQLAEGRVIWSESENVMSLACFDLPLRHSRDVEVGEGVVVGVAEVPVVVILKMAAYLDRPTERDRDLEDLAWVFERYLGDVDDRRFEEPLAALDFDTQGAFALGRDMARIVKPRHRDLVERFLARVGDEESFHHAQLLRAARRREDLVHAQFEALRAGFASGS